MIADKHPLGKFEFRITQKSNLLSSSDFSPFGTSLWLRGSTNMYGGNLNSVAIGDRVDWQYAESTVASRRSPVPIARTQAYEVEMYDEVPVVVGLIDIRINGHNSYTNYIDLSKIEEFLKSGRATALGAFQYIVNGLILPVPTERVIDMLIDNDISCLSLIISGTPSGNSFGAVGSVARVASIPLIETINVASCCTQFPDLLPAKHTLKSVTLGSPNVAIAYQMTGEIGDLRGMYRLEEFRLNYFNGVKHQYYLPVTLTTYNMQRVYNDQNLPENWLDLIELRVFYCVEFTGELSNSSEAVSIDHLTVLENLTIIGNSKFYLETDAILADTVTRVLLDRNTQFTMPRISMPDLDKPNLENITIRGYGYSYNSANRCRVTPNLTWMRNDTPQSDLDQILKDFLTDIVAGVKIAGTKRLDISQSHVNTNLIEYPTNDITELAILNGGTGYIVGDTLTTRSSGTGCTIQRTTGPLGDLTGQRALQAPLIVTNAGSGYVVGSTFRVKNDTGSYRDAHGGIVKITSVDGSGGVLSVSIVSAGGRYQHDFDYNLLAGTQATAEVTAVDGSGKITGITIDNGGSDFHEDQTVWLGGSGADASLRGRTDARRIVQYGYTVTY